MDCPVTLVLVATVHVYVVPDGIIVVGALFVGDVVNAVPLHIVAVWFGITGRGLMVATTVNVGPCLFYTIDGA